MSNFITDCINGDALIYDVDNYIDEWHEIKTDIPLNEYLGMTIKEYALFVLDEKYLAFIVNAHRECISIEYIIQPQLAMVARSDNQAKSKRLERWLKGEGLWE